MSVQTRGAALFALVLPLVLCAGAAHADRGQWSIGGNFGVGIYSGGSFNDSLEALGYKQVKDGREFGGSIRYGVSPRLSIDYEVLTLNGKGTTDSVTPKVVAEANGIATPINLYYELTRNDAYRFSLFGGAGPMFKTGWSVEQDTTEFKAKQKTTLYAHVGFEGQVMAGKRFAFTSRALGRYARAKDVEQDTDPSTKLGVSLSGFAFSIGLRAYFGHSGY